MGNPQVKKLISPFQTILIKKGKCVACLRELQAEEKKKIDNDHEMIFCKCRRIYVHNLQDDTYRRASIDEV